MSPNPHPFGRVGPRRAGVLAAALAVALAMALAALLTRPARADFVTAPARKLVYNVKDYNVKMDGATDDTTALQALVDAVPAGSKIYFPNGRCLFSALSINKILTVQGSGAGGTFLIPSSNVDFIKLNVGGSSQVSTIKVCDLSIFPTTNRSAGAALRLGYVGFCTFSDMRIGSSLGGKPYEAVRIDRASDCAFNNVRISGFASTATAGVVYQPTSGGVIVGCDWDSQSEIRSGDGDGILFKQDFTSSGTSIEGEHFNGTTIYGNAGAGVRVYPNQAGAIITGLHFNNVIMDTNTGGGYVTDSSGSGFVRRMNIDGGWISNNGGYGLYYNAETADSKAVNCNVTKNGLDGIRVDGSKNIEITGVQSYNNSQTTTATSYGITLTGSATFVRVKSCSVFNSTDFTNKQNGLFIDSTVTDAEAENTNLYVLAGQTPLTANSTTRINLQNLKISNGGLTASTLWPALYNASPDEVNYERLRAFYSGGNFVIATEKGGTGTARPFVLQSATGAAFQIASNGGSSAWTISSGGTFGPSDLAFNIGAAASVRPKQVFAGGFGANLNSTVKTANYTATDSDTWVIASTTAGSFQVTLPTAVSAQGREYKVVQTGSANTLTLGTTSSQTINGSGSTRTLAGAATFSGLDCVSNNTNWYCSSMAFP